MQRLAVEKAQAVLALHPEDDGTEDQRGGAGGRYLRAAARRRLPWQPVKTRPMRGGCWSWFRADRHQAVDVAQRRSSHAAVGEWTVEITQVYLDVITRARAGSAFVGERVSRWIKQGAYGIQSCAARWIPKIEGSPF